MKTMNWSLAGFLLVIGSGAGASPFMPQGLIRPEGRIRALVPNPTQCQDFSGHWKGECVFSGAKHPSELFVQQSGCDLLTVNGIPTAIGTSRTVVTDNIKVAGVDYGSTSTVDRVEWDASRRVLNGSFSSVSSISVPSTGYLTPVFLTSKTFRNDKTLNVEMKSGGFVYTCEFQLH